MVVSHPVGVKLRSERKALLGGHARPFFEIQAFGFLEAFDDADDALHVSHFLARVLFSGAVGVPSYDGFCTRVDAAGRQPRRYARGVRPVSATNTR